MADQPEHLGKGGGATKTQDPDRGNICSPREREASIGLFLCAPRSAPIRPSPPIARDREGLFRSCFGVLQARRSRRSIVLGENKHRRLQTAREGKIALHWHFQSESQIQTARFFFKMSFPVFLVDARRWYQNYEKRRRVLGFCRLHLRYICLSMT